MPRIKFDNPNEKKLFHAKESWVPVVIGGIPVALVCAIVSVIVVKFVAPDATLWCVLGSIIITLASRLPHIFDNWRTDVVVTDRRLYYRRGIVDVKDHVTDLGSITDVTIDPSVAGRIFNYANVRIQTKAGDDDFVLKEIASAYEMRSIINQGRDALEAPKPPARNAGARRMTR
jgi:uncharacterized membrane protein YdbT with pleckstrin-like domain